MDMKKLLVILLPLLGLCACEKNESAVQCDVKQQLFLPCQEAMTENGKNDLTYGQDTLTFIREEGNLQVTHHVWLNCGVEAGYCEVKMDGNDIIVDEYFSGEDEANCICESVMQFVLEGMEAPSYTMHINRYVKSATTGDKHVWDRVDTFTIQ